MKISRTTRLVLIALAVFSLVMMWMFLPLSEWIERFRLWIIDLGVVGIVAFVLVYVFVTVVLGPATALTMTAGLAFGFWGFPLVVGSATLAAAVAFLLGRYIARQRVLAMIECDPRLESLHQAFSDEGWRIVVLLRLSPLIPYGMQNYLFSVTNIGFLPYVVATLFGVMPASALYVYIGSLGATANDEGGVMKWLLIVGGLMATAVVAWIIGKRAQQAIALHKEKEKV